MERAEHPYRAPFVVAPRARGHCLSACQHGCAATMVGCGRWPPNLACSARTSHEARRAVHEARGAAGRTRLRRRSPARRSGRSAAATLFVASKVQQAPSELQAGTVAVVIGPQRGGAWHLA